MRHVEGVDLARTEGLVVAGDVVEWGEREVVEDKVAVERVGIEPQLVAEADPRHVRARRGQERHRAIGARRGQRRRRHRRAGSAVLRTSDLSPPNRTEERGGRRRRCRNAEWMDGGHGVDGRAGAGPPRSGGAAGAGLPVAGSPGRRRSFAAEASGLRRREELWR